MKAYKIKLEAVEVPDTTLCNFDPFESSHPVWTTEGDDKEFFNVFNEDFVEQCLLAEDDVDPKDIVFMLHAMLNK